MALVIQADPSLPGFNCYTTLAEAEIYFEGVVHKDAWTAATNAVKNSALVQATNSLDAWIFKGWQTNPAQDKQWPRNGVYKDGAEYSYLDSQIYNVYMFPPNLIPQFIKDATALYASYFIESDTTAPTGLENLKMVKVDTIQIEVDSKTVPPVIPDAVKRICWRYLKNPSGRQAPTLRVG